MPGEPDPQLYVRARTAFLDATDALRAHLDAIVLVGAQAVYLHTGDAHLAVAEYTTDADFTIDLDAVWAGRAGEDVGGDVVEGFGAGVAGGADDAVGEPSAIRPIIARLVVCRSPPQPTTTSSPVAWGRSAEDERERVGRVDVVDDDPQWLTSLETMCRPWGSWRGATLDAPGRLWHEGSVTRDVVDRVADDMQSGFGRACGRRPRRGCGRVRRRA